MNIPLLRKVQAYILAEPKRFDMASWADNSDESPCKTTLCIAGAGLTINAQVSTPSVLRAITRSGIANLYEVWGCSSYAGVEAKATEVFGLTGPQAIRLFYDFQWPDPFRTLISHSPDPTVRAAIGVARIEHFILTEGRE